MEHLGDFLGGGGMGGVAPVYSDANDDSDGIS